MSAAQKGNPKTKEQIEKRLEITNYYYEIYNSENELIYKFKDSFIPTITKLGLPIVKFVRSHRYGNKISTGEYKNWYVVKQKPDKN